MSSTALLVHAHSETGSFVTAMRNRIAETLQADGYTILHSDLYEMDWNPVLSPKDFGSRTNEDHLVYALEQRRGFKDGSLAADILIEIEKVQRADLVVFTFPLFWFNLPAILKGWIDRVFVSGTFYGGKTIYQRGGMVGKTATAAFSLGGRRDMFGPDSVHGPLVDGFLRSFFQGSLGYVGFEVIEPYVAYQVPYLSDDERRACLNDLSASFHALDSRPRVQMPDLTLFDERFARH